MLRRAVRRRAAEQFGRMADGTRSVPATLVAAVHSGVAVKLAGHLLRIVSAHLLRLFRDLPQMLVAAHEQGVVRDRR